MYRYKRIVQTIVFYGASLLLAVSYPLTAWAESVPDTQSTATTTPEPTKTDYSYDAATGQWNTSKWWYNPITKSYQAVTPKPAPVVADPVVATDPVPENTPTATTSTTGSATDTTTATMTNGVDSQAQTGTAAVTSNTAAGNATSGNASVATTLTNVVNSSVSTGGSGPATFVQNITGDVYGDIMLYPAMLAAMLAQPSSSAATPPSVAATTTTGIVNNVNLNATSGAATVSDNTSAGNATTGTANAVASVMNIINSIVAANQSFIGTINIYGNLNGDILVAPDFIPQLLASNAAASPTATLSSTNTTGITNNINLAATSGAATVSDNTSAGNATTGTASTNLVLLNLTGQQVVASNSLLVFVNVLGTWIGMIVNAPAGTTAAELGSGVTSNVSTPQTLTSTTNSQITNNIDLAAQSGDATVTGNTRAGNATSGNATSSAVILNLANSTLGLSDWFGVLFINVFGSWNGSFGIDTAAGNAPVAVATNSPAPPVAQQAIAFVAHATQASRTFVPDIADDTTPVVTTPIDQPAVLGSAMNKDVKTTTHQTASDKAFPLMTIILASLGLAGVGWWIIATARK